MNWMNGDSAVIDFVDSLLAYGRQHNASDIHIEPTEQGMRIRFRVDGFLFDKHDVDISIPVAQVIARIKILSHLDIAERRIPQDGKFQAICNGSTVDVRVSTFPSVFGQTCVLRLLDPVEFRKTIDDLGFSDQMSQSFKQCIEKETGFILVTGPTGSGKTTTLYAALTHITSTQKNIITLEDPVEYHCEGITQGHIHPDAGFTFERGIRAMLRQDPDIVMIGEIRDKQTARVSFEAALTGHLVLSTLHTNDAPSTIIRLMDMGVEPYLLQAALSAIIAQRLLRKLCGNCKQVRKATEQEQNVIASLGGDWSDLYYASGCGVCAGTGYKGRIGVFELLKISDKLRLHIIHHKATAALRSEALQTGYRPLQLDALEKVRTGTISLEELYRVLI
jgi:type II secretory ATPase GspE/PulE/Tfp pilus assembly ATPase PilB-like protein